VVLLRVYANHPEPPPSSDLPWRVAEQSDPSVGELRREQGRPRCDAHERRLEEDGEQPVVDTAKTGNHDTDSCIGPEGIGPSRDVAQQPC
jgi:hypothetical protein